MLERGEVGIAAISKDECYPTNIGSRVQFGLKKETYLNNGKVLFGCDQLQNTTCKISDTQCPVLIFFERKRREETHPNIEILTCETPDGELVMDRVLGLILKSSFLPEGHEPIPLSKAHAAMTEKLMLNQGEVISKEALLATYRDGDLTDIPTATISTQMFFLRRLIGQTDNSRTKPGPQIIKTYRDGYYIPTKLTP